MRDAMKARDTVAVGALRATLAAIDNAEAVELATFGDGATEVARHALTDDDIVRIVRAEIVEREAAADEYDRHGQAERASRLRAEARLVATTAFGDA
jgi:uncharacterized protein YqeY